ncbi:MAG: ABC transporter ATP-binding protein [Candidatus Sericytochromatia bacterium]|nr:ABC transporter ATP-binding protein [Candidatus Sericytochromatia bacterium]
MEAVEIDKISKIYEDGTQALNEVSLKVREGKIYGLLGPNGAGKSTLIGIISGTVSKTSGTAKIFGLDNSKDLQKAKLLLGVVPQEVVSEPVFTVFEVLDFFAGFYGVKKNDRKKKIDEVLEALHLGSKRNTRARFLSGGMKRRLMVAKALIHEPKLIILDEPTAGVDVELRTIIWNYVKEINKKGSTIIFTTHYLEEAEKLCSEIAIINKGKVIVEEETDKLKYLFGETTIDATLENTGFELEKILDTDIIKFNDNEVKIITKTGNESYYLQKLATLGGLKKIEIGQPSLEDIFVKLVKA